MCEVALDHALVDQIRADTFQLVKVHFNAGIGEQRRGHFQRDLVGLALQQESRRIVSI